MRLATSSSPFSLTVGDVMRSDVPSASPGESAGLAWERMRARRVDHLVVLQDDQVVGTLARHDLSGPSGGAHRRMGRTVGDLMQIVDATIAPSATVARAAKLMRRRRIACLPVLDRGTVVGMLTTHEMLGILAHRS
jgi:CBS domain-containing protein